MLVNLLRLSDSCPMFRYYSLKIRNQFLTETLFCFLIQVFIIGQVAQSVEQWTENPRVGSSILPLATIYVSG